MESDKEHSGESDEEKFCGCRGLLGRVISKVEKIPRMIVNVIVTQNHADSHLRKYHTNVVLRYIVDGFGWFWLVLGSFGWFWLVLAGSMF